MVHTGGDGGTGATVYGGAISARQNVLNMTLDDDTFTANSVTAGAGGASGREFVSGGFGGEAWGGGVAYFIPAGSSDVTTNQINIISSPFSTNQVIAGAGGEGVGSLTKGGNAGQDSGGGAIAISDDPSVGFLNTTVKYEPTVGPSSAIVGNTVTGGVGGLASSFGDPSVPFSGISATGGIGSSVHGGGIYTLNSSLTVIDTPLNTNATTAGGGGGGGFGLGDGSKGGNAGSADGGAISFNNTTNASKTSLGFSYSVDASASGITTVSGNQVTGGNGGAGGVGGSGSKFVLGGSGGNGGNAMGGGLFLMGGRRAART